MISTNKQLKKIEKNRLIELLEISIKKLESIDNWNEENIQLTLNQLLEETKEKPAVIFQLIRICLTWASFSPALNQTLAVIGKENSVNRLNISLEDIKNNL